MLRSDVLAVRTEQAKQIAKKTQAVADGVRDEVLRYEGAIGTLGQVLDRLNQTLEQIKLDYQGSQEPERCEGARDSLVRMHADVAALKEAAIDNLTAYRGRAMQCEQHLDLLNAIFEADLAEAKRLLERAEGDLPQVPETEGRHPGPSVAAKRRAEAEDQGSVA